MNVNFEKPFTTQQELRNHVVNMFAKHGHKVKYLFKLSILKS